MSDIYIRMDKDSYRFGETARIDVGVEWDPPEAKADVWAFLNIEQKDEDRDTWIPLNHYDDVGLHDADPDEPVSRTWWCHPIRRGRWGSFRATATFYEPERHGIGDASREFEIVNPDA